jgi:hypothetical protein
VFSFLALQRDLSIFRSSRTEYRAHQSLIQWSTEPLSRLPGCKADHQLYHLTMSRMNGVTSSLPHVLSWAPSGQPFITLSSLHNFVTVTLLESLTFILGVTGASKIQRKSAFVCVRYGMVLELIAAS